MVRLRSFVGGRWVEGSGAPIALVNPSTEGVVAEVLGGGVDCGPALEYARAVGGPNLRAMSFAERGELLGKMAKAIHVHREALLDLCRDNNGCTRGDAKFDVDGATATLAAYAKLGQGLGAARFQIDGEAERLSTGARYVGQHVRLPRPGAAVHINAFNFPAWGTFEKVAVALLAGVPVVSKPATATALTAFRMVEILVESGLMPEGALSFVAGPPGNLMDVLGPQDCLAFTGSADTAARLRSSAAVSARSTRVNIEADSLNAALLGPDVEVGGDLWNLAVRNIVRDMTQKTGQKCTAVRRIFVAEGQADELAGAISDELARVVVGDPAEDKVTMGPVATAAQLRDVRQGIRHLSEQARVVTGGLEAVQGVGAPEGKGYFVAPTLLQAADADAAPRAHEHEVFGPAATLIPYGGGAAEGAELLARGKGCLVSAVYGDDRDWLGELLFAAAPWTGRLQVVGTKVSDQTLPPGLVLPNQVHGGPGRAGGGEELGGLRGLDFYTQRVALQGDTAVLKKLLGQA